MEIAVHLPDVTLLDMLRVRSIYPIAAIGQTVQKGQVICRLNLAVGEIDLVSPESGRLEYLDVYALEKVKPERPLLFRVGSIQQNRVNTEAIARDIWQSLLKLFDQRTQTIKEDIKRDKTARWALPLCFFAFFLVAWALAESVQHFSGDTAAYKIALIFPAVSSVGVLISLVAPIFLRKQIRDSEGRLARLMQLDIIRRCRDTIAILQ
ncbi:hypothetical protein ONV78_24420 [Hahella sp. CR1]|uniref:hypothetical protein n=1 Tax=Hahella sp. CR1 TaxID=2992807 RepID=UPI0024416B2F|nr:hypothetical protein [Hahella sp. CR1]MDG9670907.1 hypothetical protein [Hahella sp. CR1]